MKRRKCAVWFAAVIGVSTAAWVASAAEIERPEGKVRVEPKEIDNLLANPGMGWQTFMRFADEDPNLAGLPSSTAYFRFYWKDLEPAPGEIDWAKLDELFAHGRRAGQQLALRVMCAGTGRDYDYSPPWLREKLELPGFEYRYNDGPKHWVPDLDDPRVLKRHLDLINAIGDRYDGNPQLALMDIGSVGLWGEWHMSGTGVDLPTTETRRTIIDTYCEAFPRTPLVMLIGDLEGLKHAVSRGAGWRADCLGDMGGFSKTWNHMQNFYPQQIEKAGIENAWKRGPVAFESCWTMQKWVEEGWDVERIFDWALAQHACYMNNKSAAIPEGGRPLVEAYLRLLGYRFVVRSVEYSGQVPAGGNFAVELTLENVGVSPCYERLHPAFRIINDAGASVMFLGEADVRDWLPGEHSIEDGVNGLPKDLKPGTYWFDFAIVRDFDSGPVVNLAIEGRREAGWYRMGKVEIVE
jgi:hypothetical protein